MATMTRGGGGRQFGRRNGEGEGEGQGQESLGQV